MLQILNEVAQLCTSSSVHFQFIAISVFFQFIISQRHFFKCFSSLQHFSESIDLYFVALNLYVGCNFSKTFWWIAFSLSKMMQAFFALCFMPLWTICMWNCNVCCSWVLKHFYCFAVWNVSFNDNGFSMVIYEWTRIFSHLKIQLHPFNAVPISLSSITERLIRKKYIKYNCQKSSLIDMSINIQQNML